MPIIIIVVVLFVLVGIKLFSPRKSPYSIGNPPVHHSKGGRQYR
jgi:hypothetical protein